MKHRWGVSLIVGVILGAGEFSAQALAHSPAFEQQLSQLGADLMGVRLELQQLRVLVKQSRIELNAFTQLLNEIRNSAVGYVPEGEIGIESKSSSPACINCQAEQQKKLADIAAEAEKCSEAAEEELGKVEEETQQYSDALESA